MSETALAKSKRLINLGDFSHDEQEVVLAIEPTIEGNRQAIKDARQLLNEWELEAKENHSFVRRLIQEKEEREYEIRQREEEARLREQKAQVFSAIQAHPDYTIDNLAEFCNLTNNQVVRTVDLLQTEGKIKPRRCRELFQPITQTIVDESDEPKGNPPVY